MRGRRTSSSSMCARRSGYWCAGRELRCTVRASLKNVGGRSVDSVNHRRMRTRVVELPVPPVGKGATTSSSMEENTADCLPVTAAGGHVVNIGCLAGAPTKIDIDALSCRNLTVHGVFYGFDERAWEPGRTPPDCAARCCRRWDAERSARSSIARLTRKTTPRPLPACSPELPTARSCWPSGSSIRRPLMSPRSGFIARRQP